MRGEDLSGSVIIVQAGTERRVTTTDLPVVVGGFSADIPVSGSEGAALAYIGLEDADDLIADLAAAFEAAE